MSFRKFKKEFIENLPICTACTVVWFFLLAGCFHTPWGQACMHTYERLLIRGLQCVRPDLTYIPQDLDECFQELDLTLTEAAQSDLRVGGAAGLAAYMAAGRWMEK